MSVEPFEIIRAALICGAVAGLLVWGADALARLFVQLRDLPREGGRS